MLNLRPLGCILLVYFGVAVLLVDVTGVKQSQLLVFGWSLTKNLSWTFVAWTNILNPSDYHYFVNFDTIPNLSIRCCVEVGRKDGLHSAQAMWCEA